MKDKILKNKLIILKSFFAIIFCLSIILEVNLNNYISTSSISDTFDNLSNSKIEWGIKRNDNHEQPDLGTDNISLLSEYNGIALGNNSEKIIYLTFDLGYEAGYTADILDALYEKNVPATFFITAHYLNTASDLVERMINEGHIVGNHTVNHKCMPDLSDEEIKTELMTLNQTLYEKFGVEMTYMRPPQGVFSERTLAITEQLGFKTVLWSFAYVDWYEDNQPSKEDAMQKIISNLHNGEIMLLHATSKTNAQIMSDLIDNIRAEGYEIKSLDDFK